MDTNGVELITKKTRNLLIEEEADETFSLEPFYDENFLEKFDPDVHLISLPPGVKYADINPAEEPELVSFCVNIHKESARDECVHILPVCILLCIVSVARVTTRD
jgi:hypothetical protein